MAGDREKALDVALAQIEKQFGKGSVMRLGDETRAPLEVIPTGSIALDVALGLGGLPRGRVVEIYGPESSGKTTVALHSVANAQRAGGIVAFIDAEHALDPDYAKNLGVDTDALLVSQPDSGEQALEIADMLIRSGALDLIVIDSVAALVPRAEIEGEMGDSHVGLQARLMSQALRKMTGALNNSNTTMIFINQLREKIGVMFGSPETTTGGRALKFYSSVRLDVRRIETLKDGTDMVGNRTRVKVVKNKVAPPFKQAEFDIMYGKGISREGGLIDVGVEAGLVRKAGAWYTYEGDQLGQGKENSRPSSPTTPTWPTSSRSGSWRSSVSARPSTRPPRPTTCRTSRSVSMTSEYAWRRRDRWRRWSGDVGRGGACLDGRAPRRRRVDRRAGCRPGVGRAEDPARRPDRPGAQPQGAARRSWRRRTCPTSWPSGCSTGSPRSGLVDDEAFARSWVESRQRSRGLARRALAQELRRKGVDDETARTRPRRPRPGAGGGGGPAAGPQEAPVAARGRPRHGDPAAGRSAGPQGVSRRAGVQPWSARSWARPRAGPT